MLDSKQCLKPVRRPVQGCVVHRTKCHNSMSRTKVIPYGPQNSDMTVFFSLVFGLCQQIHPRDYHSVQFTPKLRVRCQC